MRHMSSRQLTAFGAENLAANVGILDFGHEGTFIPTATTAQLLAAAKKLTSPGSSVLDLGCGWGIIGLELALTESVQLTMCDLSVSAVEAARRNSEKLGVAASIFLGDCFEPLDAVRFDLVVADVSGISTHSHLHNSWFGGVPAETGETGHEITRKLVADASTFLVDGGVVLIPVISQSNVGFAKNLFDQFFSRVERLSRLYWAVDIPNDSLMASLEEQRAIGNLTFKLEGSNMICWTDIYSLSCPK